MATISGRPPHVFGRARPSHGGMHPIHIAPERDTHFRDLPPPTGSTPFHLDLRDIITDHSYQTIVDKKKLTFHLNGDMGGILYAVPQELVAKGMEADFNPHADTSENPAFLYITGDCVYFNGEVKEYYKQFYQPYEFYHGPIFAVPGNHDGENLPGDNALDGFVRNFCAPQPVKNARVGRFPSYRHGPAQCLLDPADPTRKHCRAVQQCPSRRRHSFTANRVARQ